MIRLVQEDAPEPSAIQSWVSTFHIQVLIERLDASARVEAS
jgi:hypothetical protein